MMPRAYTIRACELDIESAASTTADSGVEVYETLPSRFNRHSIALWTCASVFFVCATFKVLLIEGVKGTDVAPCAGCTPRPVQAPFTYYLCHVAGELACFLIYYIDLYVARYWRRSTPYFDYDHRHSLPEPKGKVWFFPALLEAVSMNLLMIAFTLQPTTSAQILRSSVLSFCALFSIIYLRRDLKVAEYVGVGILTLGLVVVGASEIIHGSTETAKIRLGLKLTLASTFCTAFQIVFVENLTTQYHCNPFRSVGLLGCWQVCFSLVVLTVARFTSYEEIPETFYQLTHNKRAAFCLTSFLVANIFYTTSGLMITKLGAALLTASISVMRQLPVWFVCVMLGSVAFHWEELVGLSGSVLGFLVFIQAFPSFCCPTAYHRIMAKVVHIRLRLHDPIEDLPSEEESPRKCVSPRKCNLIVAESPRKEGCPTYLPHPTKKGSYTLTDLFSPRQTRSPLPYIYFYKTEQTLSEGVFAESDISM